MRHVRTIVTLAALWGGLVSFGMAAEPKATKAKAESKASATSDLRAEIHQTLSALNEARTAEKPDQAKVDELTQKLQQLRGKLRTQTVAAGGTAVNAWGCPRGGPGMGNGRGPGGGGGGRGAGWGGGGRGAGFGPGPGAGRGWGGGAGHGQGFGPGGGAGRGPGGPAFVDQDNDGVCDQYELRHGQHK
jgi:hypothetical protein